MQEIDDAVAQSLPGFAGGWVSSHQADRLLRDRGYRTTPRSRSELLRAMGYVRHPVLEHNSGRPSRAVAPDGTRPVLWLTASHLSLNLETPAAVADAYQTAQGVEQVEQQTA